MSEKAARALGVIPNELWRDVGKPMLDAAKQGFAEEKALDIVRDNRMSERELAFLVLVACNTLFGAETVG